MTGFNTHLPVVYRLTIMKHLIETYRKHRFVKITVDILLFIGLFFLLQSWLQRDIVNGKAPDFSGSLLSGQPFYSDSMKNKAYLLHFWATWCGICKLEQDSIQSISESHTVISIAMNSGTANAVKAYMQKHQLNFPVVLDEHGKIARRYGVSGVPASFIIAPNGEIAFSQVGYTTSWGLRIRLWWASQ